MSKNNVKNLLPKRGFFGFYIYLYKTKYHND